jgi:UTP--glucose-1-phosphate uridylyltransferase
MSSIDLFAPSSETRRLSVSLTPEQLEKVGMAKDEAADFLRLRNRFLEKTPVEWDKVEPPPEDFCRSYETLPEPDSKRAKEILDKLVVVQLNGGLGTNMGLKDVPKSGLQVLKKDHNQGAFTILDCKVLQIDKLNHIYGCDIPLVLMDSPSTHEETKKMIRKYEEAKVKIYTFVQSEHPVMHKDTLAPVPKSKGDKDFWVPPGSGEVFRGLMRSGLLEQLRSQGKEYLFISNIENLGSGVDLRLLDHICTNEIDFQLELTHRINTDQHGGVPIRY